jgi:phage tail-like protein
MWVGVTLGAGPGARLPRLLELNVLRPGRTLMEHLPSIYQREEGRPDSFLRGLVGVLETTTQDLDGRIGRMGSLIHPDTAPGEWLDFVARWLGLPWDDAMSLDQKREIVSRAEDLTRARGTRDALETLLDALAPGERRFRVTDVTADLGFATVGGSDCPGSALPAILGGWPRQVLGRMHLPRAGDHVTSGLGGVVRVEVGADAEQRRDWEPWLASVVSQALPITARLQLVWTSLHALRPPRSDETTTLQGPPAPHLGTDAITGLARLPHGDVRLSGHARLTGRAS